MATVNCRVKNSWACAPAVRAVRAVRAAKVVPACVAKAVVRAAPVVLGVKVAPAAKAVRNARPLISKRSV